MKKFLSVVFVVYNDKTTGKNFLLLGKQAPGKKLEGIRNGYGGKCEEGEDTLSCVKRELNEELGEVCVKFLENEFLYFGKVLMDEKQIDFFVVSAKEKFQEPEDNTEFVDTKWFSVDEKEIFLKEMLSGDDLVILELEKFLKTQENKNEWKEFEINKTGNKTLEGQVKNIYK